VGIKVKLQKQLSRKVKNKEYPKWVVTIPPSHIEKLKWKEGTELDALVEDNEITLRPKKK
jgi:bifunctional DNA-binding transcriptional regulator/antitoxin component of YhaV-PrlF toxin-antitoxin module